MKQLWLLALIPFPLFAADAPNVDLAATLGSLIFVIALILFFAWLLKRMRFPGVTGSPGSNMSIVKQLPVGTKERVAVVQVGEEQFLIGITSQNINMLSKLEKPLDVGESTLTPFSTQLSQLMKKNAKN
ncbi:flagellar biosynthetic protein FliO [Aliivibrio sp. S4TY2]|uniref:flagellar biosynthetic protein FliO n=1 Tax=unclassified Aliivibrio TaxID=2645654 RepID=UPI0023796933|nr:MULTISPECIES: flagellar biosynthetic protein FliO [unclassified Aliivibrio]MDD9154770.1 flagellar biosynthetic protein FliO [Aliivibrio sp. S4TY2]MDD9158867.1 flagellar biosynthetic protein FliO [Aliivibrio sp. S4TY1]MDD9162773.1 flagellar biosynthetic protein FliO [Aliivibrio sp. S4MY2]MDD9166866.1 flagellar biosynthetic protein FliO [Aliivibrio sp. S4MY4]MDD9183850.1 flagellar biosynthetic protein FliO [Aliivibrio sp. S4MY3]